MSIVQHPRTMSSFILATVVALSNVSQAGDDEYSPYLEDNYPSQVFFGDTHLHTSYSTDAGMVGATATPEDAYRFALGEEVVSSIGVRARLQRPLDFLAVTDHAENLGLAPAIRESNPALLANAWGKKEHDLVMSGDLDKQIVAYMDWMRVTGLRQDPLADVDGLTRMMWHRITAAAEKYNNPGQFTALIGFEWTLMPNGDNLHRNVIFRDGKDKADQILPLSLYDTEDPQKLWAWMASYEETTGGKMLAIPHGGNLSNGLMFDEVTLLDKKAFTADYARTRIRWEPLYEVTQIKGDSEAHSLLSPQDEFANFETWDKGSFGPTPKTDDMLPKEYARPALKRGLLFETQLGVNPYKFGMAGGTDSHTGLASSTEDNYFGKVTPMEPSANPDRFNEVIAGRPAPKGSQMYTRETGASGLTAVWARENTREEIWDSMMRKETFATTGTRMRVRLFAGWDFKASDLARPDFANYGYANGVPMGGDLNSAAVGRTPSFLIQTLRDPDGANLDRVQIVKGWVDEQGKSQEQVWDVAVSGGRTIGKNGRCSTPVGNTVDEKSASYSNDIGAPILDGYWQDPDFDPKQHAFYYVRTLEIPTPRWTTYDAKFFGVERPKDVPVSLQERAYTSPVWYTP